jgi:hypothetical protein
MKLPETKIPEWVALVTKEEGKQKGFYAEYRFLSNFYPSEVYLDGVKYPSVENAYQAAKVWPDDRENFKTCSAAESKKLWKSYPTYDKNAEEWNGRKYEVMAGLLFQKYHLHTALRKRLLETGDLYLEETNAWNDVYFGVDIKLGGENHLGKLLMKIRDFWKQ